MRDGLGLGGLQVVLTFGTYSLRYVEVYVSVGDIFAARWYLMRTDKVNTHVDAAENVPDVVVVVVVCWVGVLDPCVTSLPT